MQQTQAPQNIYTSPQADSVLKQETSVEKLTNIDDKSLIGIKTYPLSTPINQL